MEKSCNGFVESPPDDTQAGMHAQQGIHAQQGMEVNGMTISIAEPALLLDKERLVLAMNDAARQMMSESDACPVVGSQFPFEIDQSKEIFLPGVRGKVRVVETHPTWLCDQQRQVCLLTLHDVSERRWRALEADVLSEITACLQETVHRRQMMTAVMDKLMGFLKFQSCFFAVWEEESGEALIEFARGWKNPVVGLRFSGEDCALAAVMRSGQKMLNNDLQNSGLAGCPALMEEHSAAVIVPVKAGKRVIGALGMLGRFPIVEQEVNILERAAWLMGIAYHRVRLFEENESHLKRLTSLRMVNLAVSVSLDLNITLNVLLDEVTSQLDVDAADILLYNAERDVLEQVAGSGFWHPTLQPARFSLNQGLIGRLISQHSIVHLPDAAHMMNDFERLALYRKEKFASYYGVPLVVKGALKGVLELYSRKAVRADAGWLCFLETLAAETAVAIDNTELFRQLQHSHDELSLAYDATIQGWSKTLELRDLETKGHSDRVMELTLQLARQLNVPEEQFVHLRRGALLHDIGKTGIPDSILLKPGPLTDAEIQVMRKHPEYAMQLLSSVPFLRPALDIPYCHHEKWDGNGYPRGLKGEDIPLAARIFSVIDVFDALCYERPYRYAWSKKRVLAYIRERSGVDFDPRVVEAFFEIVK
ncbi:HD domain-containing phosphohydrolase [Ornatilinea apprima]|uniref:HD domain-containing phosphohydrolase n=1 Tax=Ornatilinea apprima TaxID=1134406 RepID=UPI0009E86BC4|nr:HD domain-containing phosphohydrolase [Ornatilinea apprima]